MKLLVAAAVALALAGGVGADHCTTYSTTQPTLTCRSIAMPDTGSGYYVDEDCCEIGCLFSYWIYEESNSIPGLQRGDEFVDDTCHSMIQPDRLIF